MNSGRDPGLRITATPVELPPPIANQEGDASAPIDSVALFRQRTVLNGKYDPGVFLQQLAPGTVYVDIGVDRGGGPPPPSEWPYDERSEISVHPSFTAPLGQDPELESDQGVVCWARFPAWGESWTVLVVGRRPYSDLDLARAFGAARSLEFPPTPVLTARQAVDVALCSVPKSMIPPRGNGRLDWFDAHYRVGVSNREAPFVVFFRYYDDPYQRTPTREVDVTVSRGGRVSVVQ
jgi:hypothetical protein